MEKTMMESLKEDAHMIAEMITAPLYGRPERAEEIRNNETQITNIILAYCAHAQANPEFRKDVKEHIANRLKQNK